MKFFTSGSIDFKHLFHRNTGMIRHAPHRDWLVIIAIFGAGFVLVVLTGIYLFRGVSDGVLFVPSSTDSVAVPSSLDRASLVSTMSYYTDKAAKLETLKSSPLNLIDPSI